MTKPDGVDPPGLLRSLRRIDVFALTVNVVVGAGVFAMPAGLAAAAGRWSLAMLVVAFAVVALPCCVAIVLTTSWLAVRDVTIALAVGLAIRAWVRWRATGSKVQEISA